MLTPPFCLIGRPRLHAFRLLRPPLSFNFLRGVGPSSHHDFLTLVFPIPFMVRRVGTSLLGRWKSRKPGLGWRSRKPNLGNLPGCFPQGWDSNNSWKVVLNLCWMPISIDVSTGSWRGVGCVEKGEPRSPGKVSGDKSSLKISNLSSESNISTTTTSSSSSSFIRAG